MEKFLEQEFNSCKYSFNKWMIWLEIRVCVCVCVRVHVFLTFNQCRLERLGFSPTYPQMKYVRVSDSVILKLLPMTVLVSVVN